jgi:hypothetical protein
MSRWFRFYDDAVNDPKILKLPEAMRWSWVAILCIASKNDGVLPVTADIAVTLRLTVSKASAVIASLKNAGLIDFEDGVYVPHNWGGRQFKSDGKDETAAERMRRYRALRRNDRNGDGRVTVLEQNRTEQKDSEAKASGAGAPDDPRKRLFNEGLSTLAKITGKGKDACRSFVGKCLKSAGDDAIIVLGLIEDAERNQVVDASAWIAARLKGRPEFSNAAAKPQNSLLAAIDRQLEKSIAEDADFAATANPVLRLSH